MSVSAKQLVDEAKLTIPEISAADTNEKLQNGEVHVLLDVREPAEWEKGHAPKAIHAPRGLLEWLADPSYANHEPRLAGRTNSAIVVMCASGGRSLLAARTLREMGYTDVSSMTGGINSWTECGLPVESIQPQ
jgi:rhodanese-related sulfurtransferase